MGFANPASEFPKDVVSQFLEDFRTDDTRVVIGPTSDDGVERFNQTPSIAAMEPLEGLLEFLSKRRHTGFSGFNWHNDECPGRLPCRGGQFGPTAGRNLPFCSTKIGVTGLRLAVVRCIVAAHADTFTNESSLDIGTVHRCGCPWLVDAGALSRVD